MSRQVHVTKRGEYRWDVVRCRSLHDGAWEYETIGRIEERDDGFFYAQLPLWQDIGHAWEDARLCKARATRAPIARWLDENDGRPNPPAFS